MYVHVHACMHAYRTHSLALHCKFRMCVMLRVLGGRPGGRGEQVKILKSLWYIIHCTFLKKKKKKIAVPAAYCMLHISKTRIENKVKTLMFVRYLYTAHPRPLSKKN